MEWGQHLKLQKWKDTFIRNITYFLEWFPGNAVGCSIYNLNEACTTATTKKEWVSEEGRTGLQLY